MDGWMYLVDFENAAVPRMGQLAIQKDGNQTATSAFFVGSALIGHGIVQQIWIFCLHLSYLCFYLNLSHYLDLLSSSSS